MTAPKPAGRLTTQNLVISAGVATEGHRVDWPAIQDLSTLIDLFCIYDSATVLGRPQDELIPYELGNLLLSSRFLNIDSPGDDMTELVSVAARSHLLAYLGGDEDDSFEELLQVALSPGQAFYGLRGTPDRSYEVAEGEAWLKAGGTRLALLDQLRHEGRVARSTTFVVRSFLYLGLALIRFGGRFSYAA